MLQRLKSSPVKFLAQMSIPRNLQSFLFNASVYFRLPGETLPFLTLIKLKVQGDLDNPETL